MAIEVGQQAPDFTLTNQHGEEVTLSSFRGSKNVVLVFYPFAFSGLCTGELCEIRDQRSALEGDDTVVMGISCDPMWSLRFFAEKDGLDFPLLSDFWPHGAVCQAYGAFFEPKGMATRATYIIDKDGVVRWSVINGPGDVRSTQDYKDALAALA